MLRRFSHYNALLCLHTKTKIRKTMKNLIAATALMLFAPMALVAQNINIQNYPHIDVPGHAEAKVQPDTFEITVAFGETKEFFGKQNIEKLEQQIINVLKKHNIDVKKDVKVTGSYNVADGKTVFIRKRITFSVGSYAAYYAIAKELDFKGVEKVSITKASYSGEDALKSSLRAKAMADARKSADEILSGSGTKTGRILSVNAGRAYVQARMVNTVYMADMAVAAKASGYESIEQSDDITITFDLQASFEIVQPN